MMGISGLCKHFWLWVVLLGYDTVRLSREQSSVPLSATPGAWHEHPGRSREGRGYNGGHYENYWVSMQKSWFYVPNLCLRIGFGVV